MVNPPVISSSAPAVAKSSSSGPIASMNKPSASDPVSSDTKSENQSRQVTSPTSVAENHSGKAILEGNQGSLKQNVEERSLFPLGIRRVVCENPKRSYPA